uniref:PID domain-containing protein n=1 Tax=Angiostrongylus cantonensis TaxID=6313 RepID=A0A0K0DIA4_ANGCA
MPFLANPFMSPFMPQQGMAADVGVNATMPAFFFSPAQYQEMMQQYFTYMMSANQYGMNMAFPMPFGTALARPSSQSSVEEGSTKSEGEETYESPKTKLERKSSLPTEDEKTTNLIRKQMSEIEKEITRRSQNKNVKKTLSTYRLTLKLMPRLFYSVIIQNVQPSTSAGKPSLNQLRSSFNLPDSGTTPVRSHHHAHDRTTTPVTLTPQRVCRFLFPTTYTSFYQPSSSVRKSITSATDAPVESETVGVSSCGTLAPPPPPSRPSAQSNTGWLDENKESGTSEEPVWVLRDSYLKRTRRERKDQECLHEFGSGNNITSAASSALSEGVVDGEEVETDRLLLGGTGDSHTPPSSGNYDKKKNKETMVHEPAVLIEGVLFRARYLGSTQMMYESRGSKMARMAQAQEAVGRVKAPEGEIQPSTEIDLFISTEKIMVLNTDLQRISDTDVRQDILMDHALRTISYIADIGDLVVLMARRMSASSSDEKCDQVDGVRKTPKVICHVFESDEASFIAQSIGQAFQVAYVEFLRANGINDPSYLRQIDYQEVLNSQELLGDELEMFARKETQKDVVVPKKNGEPLGIVVVESGWGSMLPTVVLAHMNPSGPAARSNQLNIGDQIININGISLVGLPLSAAQTNIKNMKTATAVRLTVVSTPPVVEVRIRRPDTKYQLGFSVQNGVICSLLRGEQMFRFMLSNYLSSEYSEVACLHGISCHVSFQFS